MVITDYEHTFINSTTKETETVQIKTGLTRVSDNEDYHGTIMYIGTVASTSAKHANELYAGIAWDDAQARGKHDGSVTCRVTGERIQYFCYPKPRPSFAHLYNNRMLHTVVSSFSTRENDNNRENSIYNQNSNIIGCSFVKLNQKKESKQKLDFGVALDDILLGSRYVKVDDPHLVAPHNIITGAAVRTSSGRTKPIELVGELKIRARQQIEHLDEVSLRNARVSSICIDVPTNYSHLRGMDLSGNLLSDWQSVVLLLEQFPLLEELQLTSNLLRDIVIDDDKGNVIGTKMVSDDVYPNMRRLVLNRCGICSFRTMQILNHFFPNLEELCATENDFSDLGFVSLKLISPAESNELTPSPIHGFSKLSLLDLSDCCISSWSHLERLRLLPNLESLIVNENGIESLDCGNAQNDSYFPALTALHIVQNLIEKWEQIEPITNLNVTSLRFRNNPISKEMGQSEFRSLTIARLPKINFLNASPVTIKERIEAERRYIRVIGRILLGVSTKSSTDCDNESIASEKKSLLLKENPRFEELVKKHKDSMVGLSNEAKCENLAADTINVTIICMAASGCTIEPLHKRLPNSLKVGRLKSMCARAFQVDYDQIILHFRESKVRS